MVTAIVATGTPIVTTGTEKVIIRSDNATDLRGINIYVGATPNTATIAGTSEVIVGVAGAITNVLISGGSGTAGNISIRKEGTKAIGYLFACGSTNAVNNDTIQFTYGTTTESYTFKTSGTGESEVTIGASIDDTLNALALNITNRSTGLMTASYSSGRMTLTDRVGCFRSGTWGFTGTGAIGFNFAALSGGSDGDLVVSLPSTTTAVSAQITLDNETLITKNLLIGQFVSDWYAVGGRAFSIYLSKNADTITNIGYEVSLDRIYEIPGVPKVAIAPSHSDKTRMVISPTEDAVEFVRLRMANNTSAAIPCSAKIVTGR